MKREEIPAVINQIFIEILEIEKEQLKPETKLFEDLGLDSLDMVDLMIGLQRKFGISLRENKEIRTVKTLGDVYGFFEKLYDSIPEEQRNAL